MVIGHSHGKKYEPDNQWDLRVKLVDMINKDSFIIFAINIIIMISSVVTITTHHTIITVKTTKTMIPTLGECFEYLNFYVCISVFVFLYLHSLFVFSI